MTLKEKVERSKSSERIDFTKIGCLNEKDPLVPIQESDKIMVEPVWLLPGDLEGGLYAAYIAMHPAYDKVYVRAGLLERLEKAANTLPRGLKLMVRAGHRPIEVQKQLLMDVAKDFKQENPGTTDEQALAHARTYVSDPAIKLPPHCCGAAVDVELYDTETKQLVDFGSTLDTDEDISYLHSDQVTQTQKDNRMLLLRTMLDADFSSYYAEWWHFSYGDEIWAWFYGHKDCLYNLAEYLG